MVVPVGANPKSRSDEREPEHQEGEVRACHCLTLDLEFSINSGIELPTLRLLDKHELKVEDAGRNAHDGEGLCSVTKVTVARCVAGEGD
jgi:hypothetical protein